MVDAGRGPITVLVPEGYDAATPAPLMLLLHGYTSSGAETEAVLQFAPVADARGMLYAFPDGTEDFLGNRFWNATDACCNFFASTVDDSAYLLALIQQIEGALSVDPERVFVSGHSNGGFMAYRFACDHADVVSAVVSVAGATFLDPTDCSPSEPVRTLQIHGTADGTIDYDGGFTVAFYPGALETTETWATYNGCDLPGVAGPTNLDLDSSLPGDETMVLDHTAGCDPGGASSLWTIVGGAHAPTVSASFGPLVADFLLGSGLPFTDGFESGDTGAWTDTVGLLP